MSQQRLVISILAIRGQSPNRKVLLQRRNKENDDTPYTGYLELPQGKVEAGESLLAAARREVAEETGLRITNIIHGAEERMLVGEHSDLYISRPLVCVADRIQNHFAVAVVAFVAGNAKSSTEADSHAWYTDEEVWRFMDQGVVFPLNIPMLVDYLRSDMPHC